MSLILKGESNIITNNDKVTEKKDTQTGSFSNGASVNTTIKIPTSTKEVTIALSPITTSPMSKTYTWTDSGSATYSDDVGSVINIVYSGLEGAVSFSGTTRTSTSWSCVSTYMAVDDSDHNIYLEGDTVINGDMTCSGFSIDTLSQDSSIGTLKGDLSIETLKGDLVISDGGSGMDVQLPNINFSYSDVPAKKISLKLEQGHYSNKNYDWLTATLDYNYLYIFSIKYDGTVYSGLFYFDQDLSTNVESTVHLMNLNNSKGDGLGSDVRLFASSWETSSNKWSNKVGFRPIIVNVGEIVSKASGYSLYKIPYHFNISGYDSSI